MKRLVQTSSGWIELDFRRSPYPRFLRRISGFRGYSVLITPFGRDGWSARDEIGWLSDAPKDGRPFSSFLAEVTAIPLDEAEQIAAQSLEEWERRG